MRQSSVMPLPLGIGDKAALKCRDLTNDVSTQCRDFNFPLKQATTERTCVKDPVIKQRTYTSTYIYICQK